MEWEAAFVAYGMITVIAVAGAGIAWAIGDSKVIPIAFIFWPIIALTACIVTVKRMWRDG